MRKKDQNKIAKIFASTVELSNIVGIPGLTMAKIAKDAGMATGTLYIYFENKDLLLNALYQHLKSSGNMSNYTVSPDESIYQQMKELWEMVFQFRVQYFKEVRFLEQFTISPIMSEKNRQIGQDFKAMVEELLFRGKERGELKEISNNILYPLISGAMKDMSYEYVQNKNQLTADYITTSFEPIWSAISI